MKLNLESKYFKQGLTIFLTLATLVIFYFVLINLKGFSSWLGKLKDVAMPFVWGFVIAYILNSPYKRLKRLIAKKFPKAAKPVSVITVFTVFIVAMTLFFYMVVPQIVNAITGLSDALPIYIYRAQTETEGFFENYLERFDLAEKDIQNVINYVSDNLFKNFDIRNVVDKTLQIFINTTVGIKNFLMGLIIAIYFLIDKKRFIKTGKKILYFIFGEKNGNLAMNFCAFTDRTFGQFILSKVVDSAIIGVMCYIGMLILRLEYPLLISLIVGITNLIPFFGPFIGAIPSIILLFLISPMQSLIFAIFIFLLQQFDGNYLGPKLMGDSIGIRSVYVIFAVVIGGGFFGPVGMFLGVPVFAIIYTVISHIINKKLYKEGIEI